jgi:hypothetical protein
MNCKQITPLLYLYREGELDKNEQQSVREHLATCDACQDLYLELRSEDDELSHLRQNKFAPRDSQALTHRIMQQVKADNERRLRSGQSRRSGSILDRLAVPGARYAMTFALVVILSLFAIQEFYILHKISALEARFEYTDHRGATELSSGGYVNGGDLTLTPVEMEILEKWVVIRRSRVEDLIGEIEALEVENQALKRKLEESYPGLVTYLDSRGMTERELVDLLNNRRELLMTLKKM